MKIISKYHKVIHVLFWCLVGIVTFIAVTIVLTQSGRIDPIFFNNEKETVQVEPVVITKIKQVKEETEWFYFVATGYSSNDPEQGTNNITASGKEIKTGMVAVDTKIIPLGTVLEIKDMGIFTAEDTGGKIKGNRIDIYFKDKDAAREFGRKVIWVRALNKNIELTDLMLYE